MLSFWKTEKGKAIEEISSKSCKRALLWNFCKMSKQLPLVNVRTCNSGFAVNFCVSFIIFFPRGCYTFFNSNQNSFISAIPNISHRGRNTRGENWMLWKGQSEESTIFPDHFPTIFSHFFDNYLYIFLKTEDQTVILRCWTSLNHNWFKTYDTKCNVGRKQ